MDPYDWEERDRRRDKNDHWDILSQLQTKGSP